LSERQESQLANEIISDNELMRREAFERSDDLRTIHFVKEAGHQWKAGKKEVMDGFNG